MTFDILNRILEEEKKAAESVAAGWFVEDKSDRTLVWHNGYASGFGAHMVLDRQRRRGAFISVVSPYPDPDIEPVAMTMLDAAV